VSARTAIALETLGAPDNDSEGFNCYASEKGIQALPSKKKQIEDLGEAGAYLCKFFMCGKTYYVFSRKIIDENGNPVKAVYMEFVDGGIELSGKDELLDAPPEFYFNKDEKIERDIKTVSYMTLTNKEFNLYEISKNMTHPFIAEKNILAVFSCNILAFQQETNGNLAFVKTPVFHHSTSEDVSDISPLQVYIYRAFIPHQGTNVVAEECGKHGNGFGRLLLHEESIFLYDKDSRKIKALLQRRRRLTGDKYDDTLEFDESKREMYIIHGYYFNPFEQFFYVHAFYVFNIQYPNLYGAREKYQREWSDGNYSIDWWLADDPTFNIHKPFPSCVFMANSKALFALSPEIKDRRSVSATSVHYKWYCTIQLVPANFMEIDKETTIDEVMDYAKTNPYPTPDSGEVPDGWHSWVFISQELKDPNLFVNLGQTHRQKYLWAQRSRLFSLGTMSYKNVWPYSPYDDLSIGDDKNIEKMELRRFRAVQMRGNDDNTVTGIELNEDVLGNFEDLNNIKFYMTYFGRVIYSLFEWPQEEIEIEYANEVYHTMVGNLGFKFEDSPYFVPSNVSDEIIGLYGQDRNIFTISQKSIEQFNIADIDASPVQFVRLERTYDMLVDWSGLNGKLDILTKELGQYIFNGTPRVKRIFGMDSRILPATMIKSIMMDVVQTGEYDIRLIDANKREFLASIYAPIHAITLNDRDDIFADAQGLIWETSIDDGNFDRFAVSWNYRTGRNILLGRIAIRTAQFGPGHATRRRKFSLLKDGMPLRERDTINQTVEFYKIGMGLNNRLSIEMEGYLREVEIEDTERGQK